MLALQDISTKNKHALLISVDIGDITEEAWKQLRIDVYKLMMNLNQGSRKSARIMKTLDDVK